MDNGIVDDIAWPVNIETMVLEQKRNNQKEEKKRRRRICGFPFFPCLLLCLLGLLLTALSLLVAILASIFARNRNLIAIINITNDSYIYTTLTTIEPNTTTGIRCGSSCLYQSWIDNSSLIAQWSFDGTYTDKTNVYNPLSTSNLPTLAPGYIGQAALFNASNQEAIYVPYVPLGAKSFTIEAWIKPTGYPNSADHSIIGLCPSQIIDHCLHINIRHTKLYFGFYYDDVQGGTTIPLNQWMHVAFVFDTTYNMQTIYLNGVAEAAKPAVNMLQVLAGAFTIGINEGVSYPNSYFQGYIDQLTVSLRAKSSCEILEQATLAAYFKFDITRPYTDSGFNSVDSTFSTTSIIDGHNNQAISFTGTSSSYFQTSGFTSFGISNQSFSIAFWIQPRSLSGTLVHLSTSSVGTGSTCFPLLGFSSNGTIVAQVLTNTNTIIAAIDPTQARTLSWIFVVQTWSSSNGLRLYIDNILVSSITASTFLASETTPNYLTLGNCLSGCTECLNGSIDAPGPFIGSVDDWRIFNRELTVDDVCALYIAN